jgi:hypothetical protein
MVCLAAASTIAGNLTIMAAASNIIIIEASESRGVKAFTFLEFFKVGAIIIAVNVTVLYLFLFHYLPVQSSLLGDQSLLGSVNIPINIDITAIVPINVNIQNAQICLQVGGGSCTQVVLNPTQTTYSPTTINLAQPTPTITPTPTTTTTALAPTTTTAQTPPPTTATPLTPPSTTTTTSPPTSTLIQHYYHQPVHKLHQHKTPCRMRLLKVKAIFQVIQPKMLHQVHHQHQIMVAEVTLEAAAVSSGNNNTCHILDYFP